mgnify:CR=1 FL=1
MDRTIGNNINEDDSRCKYCKKKFKNKNGMLIHMGRSHSSKPKSPRQKVEKKPASTVPTGVRQSKPTIGEYTKVRCCPQCGCRIDRIEIAMNML